MKSNFRLFVLVFLCCLTNSYAQQDTSLLFSCFDIDKNINDWFSTIEKELTANKIIDENDIYLDLHLISLFDSYNSEFNFSQRQIIDQIYTDNGISMSVFSKNDQCFKKKSQIVKEKIIFKELLKADAVFFRKIDSLRIDKEIKFTTEEEESQFYKSIAREMYSDQYFNDQDFKIFLLMQLYYYFNKDEFKKIEAQRENLHQIEDTEETVPIIDDERNN
ncbi:hypothetical protein [uncultured Aquimarina sp.]|uniref:hypothetical protein n=1 Tax=uncultured Aquimarina sp. TaxID=575652 RepID=UPI002604C091|nr:hypothetical protein [uncultured Aquimarina sp.]